MKMQHHYHLTLSAYDGNKLVFKNNPLFGVCIFALLCVMFFTAFVVLIQPMPEATDKSVLSSLCIIFLFLCGLGLLKSFFTDEKLVLDKGSQQAQYTLKTPIKSKAWDKPYSEFKKLVIQAQYMGKDGQPALNYPQNSWIFELEDLSGHRIMLHHGIVALKAKDLDSAKKFASVITRHIDVPVEAPWLK